MKNFLILATLTVLFLSSCKTSELTGFTDDVYVNPTEEKIKAKLAFLAKAKADSIKQKQEADAYAEEKAKEDANPYYKDPDYNQDDYYDYQYASRINRFYTPLSGAGYYDNYYTNCYSYNQNPLMYGTSIYSTYNYWTPSSQFGYYNNGLTLAFGNNYYGGFYGSNFGYNPYAFGYSPYGNYGNWFGYNNYGWNNYNAYNFGYTHGYNQGFNNGWNMNNWGYFNRYDANSAYSQVNVGPRGSNGGGNSSNRTNAGMQIRDEDLLSQKYIQSVNEQQNQSPRFSNSTTQRVNRNRNLGIENTSLRETNSTNQSTTNSNRVIRRDESAPTNTNSNRSNSSQRVSRRENSSTENINNQTNSNRSSEKTNWNSNTNQQPSNSGGRNNGGSNSTSTPRSSGGGRTR